MKIGIVGCGAVGSFYGAKLLRSGHEVHFLLRSDYDTVRQDGVQILSPDGDFRIYPHAAERPEAIGVCDLVTVGLKTTANDAFPRLIPPLLGSRTRVLTLQNGLGNEERLAGLLDGDRILGGLCFVCLNRIRPGIVRHTAHGRIVLGEFRGGPTERTRALAETLEAAGIPCTVADDLEKAHWEKLVWNIPFNGVGVAGTVGYDALVKGETPRGIRSGPCLTTDVLLQDRRWEALIRELMHEVILAANSLGLGIEPSLADLNIERTRSMGAYKASTLLDFETGRSLELHSLFLEPQRQARLAGVSTPRLDRLCAVLRELDTLPG